MQTRFLISSRMVLVITAALGGFLAVMPVLRVWAQGVPKAEAKKKADPEGSGSEDTPKVKVERGAGGKKVYVIKTGFVIEGRIQKPNAFYVLQRSQINYDWAALKQRFVPRILESLNKSPF